MYEWAYSVMIAEISTRKRPPIPWPLIISIYAKPHAFPTTFPTFQSQVMTTDSEGSLSLDREGFVRSSSLLHTLLAYRNSLDLDWL